MRRLAYPYGRYLIKDQEVSKLGPKLKSFIERAGFSIIKYDEKNEGSGTVVIAVNKKVGELMKQKKPPGQLDVVYRAFMSGFTAKMPNEREVDVKSQRVGIELYLWPIAEGTLLEIFVIPYMEHLNRPEIPTITQSKEEEITDWYLCEQTWESFVPKIEAEFDTELVHRRAMT